MHLKKKSSFSQNKQFQQFLLWGIHFPILELCGGFSQVKLGSRNSVYRCCKIFININQTISKFCSVVYVYLLTKEVHLCTHVINFITCKMCLHRTTQVKN